MKPPFYGQAICLCRQPSTCPNWRQAGRNVGLALALVAAIQLGEAYGAAWDQSLPQDMLKEAGIQ